MRPLLRWTALLLLPLAACAQDAKAPRVPEVLWRPPAAMTSRDWICGPGGCDRAPKPPYRFLRQEGGGSTPKILVRDGNGRVWSVKFGGKVIPECFAARFVDRKSVV